MLRNIYKKNVCTFASYLGSAGINIFPNSFYFSERLSAIF